MPVINLQAQWHAKIVEPEKRNKDGMRWIFHRFPIKGGISPREAFIRDMARPSPILQRLLNRVRIT